MAKIKEKPQHYFQGTNSEKLKEVSSSHNVNLCLDYTQNGLINGARHFFNPAENKFILKTKLYCLVLPYLKS